MRGIPQRPNGKRCLLGKFYRKYWLLGPAKSIDSDYLGWPAWRLVLCKRSASNLTMPPWLRNSVRRWSYIALSSILLKWFFCFHDSKLEDSNCSQWILIYTLMITVLQLVLYQLTELKFHWVKSFTYSWCLQLQIPLFSFKNLSNLINYLFGVFQNVCSVNAILSAFCIIMASNLLNKTFPLIILQQLVH